MIESNFKNLYNYMLELSNVLRVQYIHTIIIIIIIQYGIVTNK